MKKYVLGACAIVSCFAIAGCGSTATSGEDVLQQSSSAYDKVCTKTLYATADNSEVGEATIGLYMKDSIGMMDRTVIWDVEAVRNMENSYIEGVTDEDSIVGNIGTLTMYSVVSAGTKTTENNYYKDDKVYITDTYQMDEESTPEEIGSQLTEAGYTCK